MPKKTGKRGKKKTVKKKARKPIRKPVRKTPRKAVKKKKTARKAVRPPKKTAKKSAMKIPTVVKPSRPSMESRPVGVPAIAEQRVGVVIHYYSHLSVAVVKLDQGALQVGDSIHIKGHTTDLQQQVESIQIEHQPIQRADMGQECALKVTDHVREHDIVYKLL